MSGMIRALSMIVWVFFGLICSFYVEQTQSFAYYDLITHQSSINPKSKQLIYTGHQDSSFSRLSSTGNVIDTPKNPQSIDLPSLHKKLDKDFVKVAFPAFISLTADPLASIVDAMYVGRLGAVEQAAMGIAISAQFSVAKLYNDPLLKTSTSLVAGKEGDILEASVATAVVTAMVIGVMQSIIFFFCGELILRLMGVKKISEMMKPAVAYLKYRALGIPAATIVVVTNGIFRGRGDTQTPLYCTSLGNLVNILLDPILIFSCGMGCSGAGLATSVSQWVAAVPMIWTLNNKVPIKVFGREKKFYVEAFRSYFKAGSLILARTVAKIFAYGVTASSAARLGTVSMAAYSLTFNLGFATSQLCESIAIAGQALLARDYPFSSTIQKLSARHVIRRANVLGFLVSLALSITTYFNEGAILSQLTKSPEVLAAASAIMPVVLLTQLFKGLAYSTGGILLGGLDWLWSSLGMQISTVICVGLVYLLPNSLWNIWVALAAFMATQVFVSGYRFLSNKGPWEGLNMWEDDRKDINPAI